MKKFMDDDLLLQSDTAKHLFHDIAEELPIIDYHCHLDPREIYEDIRFNDLGDIWLGGRREDGRCIGDHYKWRLMRANGVEERLVTGRGDERARFRAFADSLAMAAGNPMYHWCHLELKKYFGINEPLSAENADRIWDRCEDILKNDPGMSARGIIKKSRVEYIGTTDDPADSLEWHEKIAADKDIGFTVRPAFRPDKAIDITKDGFAGYVRKLAQCAGAKEPCCTQDVIDILLTRLGYFLQHGCLAADHGFERIPYRPVPMEICDAAFQKAMCGERPERDEAEGYQTAVLSALARSYSRHGIVMELHYSCLRNVNERMFGMLGPDTGYDTIASNTGITALAAFLSELDKTGELPKTVIFSADTLARSSR